MFRVGNTLSLLILMSNKMHLSNFGADKKDWPVYMTFGNLSSKIHQMPLTHSIVMVALLAIWIKDRNIAQKRLEYQWQTKREEPNEVLQRIPLTLTLKLNPSAKGRYYNVLCADCNFTTCKPVFRSWLSNCPEFGDLHHSERLV